MEGRIKEHTREMQERRRKPKATPQEEMNAAKRELEVVSAYDILVMCRLQLLNLTQRKPLLLYCF